MNKINDLNVTNVTSLIPPQELKNLFPITAKIKESVFSSRNTIVDIITKQDKRLLAIVGPCSIHDSEAAVDYAERLSKIRKKVEDKIFIIMRVYFEKPRTTVGWKGLITDPHLDNSYDIETGLKIARKLLLDITALGLPCGSEMLDPIVPQYLADLISWAAIGARTTESQTHRELASGLSMPVGFKNSTSGNIKTAAEAILSSRQSHSFIGIDKAGQTSIIKTAGNPFTHVILRGGNKTPNYYEESVEDAEEIISSTGVEPSIIIDCSHANSKKDHNNQKRVLNSVITQKKNNKESIVGFMLESNIMEGCQRVTGSKNELEYGKSITDSCINWEETENLLLSAYDSLKTR